MRGGRGRSKGWGLWKGATDKGEGLVACFSQQEVTFYGSEFIDDRLPVDGTEVKVEGLSKPAVVNSDGMYLFGNDGKKVGYCTFYFRV